MKLINKQTGKVGWLYEHSLMQDMIFVYDLKGIVGKYTSLTELSDEWEDYEEPKEYWYVSCDGRVLKATTDEDEYNEKHISGHKEIGNHFETKEEAEKAVEKLKAWKRLKDYNVKFNLDFVCKRINFTYSINKPLLDVLDDEEQIFNNMKIVFGGEE